MKLTQAYLRKLILEQLLNEVDQPVQPVQPVNPQRKDLESFQARQHATITITKEVVADKVGQYLQTLKGLDIEKNKSEIINGLSLLINNIRTNQLTQTTKAPAGR
jgi:hypothetical protein